MTEIFDLFGDPVSANHGRRGRPEHIPTDRNRSKVKMLLAFGWSNGRIAKALCVTEPTLRKHYFSELKFRDEMRDRMDARVAEKLWAGVEEGSVSAIKEFRKFVERNDLMLARPFGPLADKPKEKKAPKLGKKEHAKLAANAAPEGDWGALVKRPN